MPSKPRSFVIEGEPVSGKNSMRILKNRKTGGRYIAKSAAASTWGLDAIRQLGEQRTKQRAATFRGPVRIDYVAYQVRDTRDIDNIEAALFDALKKAQVIADDLLIVDHRGQKRVDPNRPRIELTISEAA